MTAAHRFPSFLGSSLEFHQVLCADPRRASVEILSCPESEKKKNKMTHGAPSKKKSDSADDDVIPPPDGGWGWMVVFGSFMIHIVGNDF